MIAVSIYDIRKALNRTDMKQKATVVMINDRMTKCLLKIAYKTSEKHIAKMEFFRNTPWSVLYDTSKSK